MHIALTILIACLIIILLLVLIILLAPLSYKLDLTYNDSLPQFKFTLRNYCYGLQASRQGMQLNLQLIIMGFSRSLKQPFSSTKATRTTEPVSSQKTFFSPHLLKQLALENAWKQHLGRLIKDIWCIIRPHKIFIKARVGFTEPHYTGWLMGLAGILQGLNNSYCIQLEGVWDEPCIEGALILSGRLIPIQLIWQLLKFMLKPQVRSAYKLIRTQKSPSPYQTTV